ncbi:glycosyltransferase [Psychrobium sp. 1_MG-2023]|uniref:glycosyltransferase n=1 Tax=Psychrobium sp. 1_MG-2023 TaxID=3062624 RepID=UPI000C31C3F0|nr:glycosyltransferase [Psychrobium sp. 1_MG-2023]MDP2562088.1 glycosyltransferase [Psychrobium sp. 1_MG-2023]PKF55687.1 hypothetical protein CW748_12600 [Alteromonadales bacterium alter-6D02]
MKTVLHFIHSLDIGGGSMHVDKLTSDLCHDYRHIVLGCSGSYEKHLRDKLGNDLYCGDWLTTPFILLKLILTKKLDVIHFHGRMAGVIGRLMSSFSSVKKVYTIHGFSFESDGTFKKMLFILFERLLAYSTDTIIFVSRDERKLFHKVVSSKHIKKERIVFNYLNSEHNIGSIKRDITARDTIKAIYVGRMSKEKGVDILLQAIKNVNCPNLSLDLIGEGPYLEEFKRLSRELELDQCIFHGAVANASQLLSDYDFLFIPSRYEGMPYIMIEGVTVGIPIVCTPARGIKEFLNRDNSYIADELSVASLTSATKVITKDFRENPKAIASKLLSSSKLLSCEFNKDAQLKKLKDIYN